MALRYVFPDVANPTQCIDALHLCLLGGYGMFFDGDAQEVLLCKECADRLVALFPSFLNRSDYDAS